MIIKDGLYDNNNRNGSIYKITNIINDKCYIGQTAGDKKCRWNGTLNDARSHYNRHFYRAVNKYGAENFKIDIIKKCSEDELDDWETYYISYYNSTDRRYGYNMESGGNKNKHHCEESRRKMSKSHIGKKQSEETKKKQSESHKGKKLSKEHIKNLSESHKGKLLGYKQSEEHKRNLSESHKNPSEETRKKMSKAKKGNKNALGCKYSEETRKKMSESKKGKKQSEEHIRKRVKSNTGKKRSKETRQKMSKSHKEFYENKYNKISPEQVKMF